VHKTSWWLIAPIAILITVCLPSFAQSARKADSPPAAKGQLVDINRASEAELDKLPGIGPATAKKIIAGRPYASIADLSRAGVSKRQLDQITPFVTVSPAAAPPSATAPGRTGSANRSAPAENAQAPSTPGMVWVNTESKVYHKEGDRWYGKTKQGKYMTESEAIAAGYRAAKR
jgi:hypothetical protein